MIPPFVIEKLKAVKPQWSPLLFKAGMVTLFLLALVVPLALVAVPFIEFLNGMAAQPKGRAQMTYGRTDGQTLVVERPPVEGTIPRGYVPYPYADYGKELEDAYKAVRRFVGRDDDPSFPGPEIYTTGLPARG